jgi:hypothetical protein
MTGNQFFKAFCRRPYWSALYKHTTNTQRQQNDSLTTSYRR